MKFRIADTFRTQNLISLLVVLYKRVTNNSLKARKSKCTQMKDEQTALQKNASWIFFLLSLHLSAVMFRVNGFFFFNYKAEVKQSGDSEYDLCSVV